MGLICPLLIILKIHLRELFGPGSNLGWDEPVPSESHEKWVSVISMFLRIGDIILNRSVRPEGTEGLPELIGFSDGSLVAYGCTLYVRWKKSKSSASCPDRYFVKLVCGKARVTSARGTTAPRSEVCGYLVLTRLLKTVVNAMEAKQEQITVAMDSQCTISAVEKWVDCLLPTFQVEFRKLQLTCRKLLKVRASILSYMCQEFSIQQTFRQDLLRFQKKSRKAVCGNVDQLI